jgi:hypothetical protein
MKTCTSCGKQMYDQDTACTGCGTSLLPGKGKSVKPSLSRGADYVPYDPRLIQEFAQRLYSRAANIVVVYTLAGAAIGWYVGKASGGPGGTYPTTAAIIGAVLGFGLGMEKAFWLKLQAQLALCQVQIEKNTRTSGE